MIFKNKTIKFYPDLSPLKRAWLALWEKPRGNQSDAIELNRELLNKIIEDEKDFNKTKNKVYLLNFPRPVGIEPTIYFFKPIIKPYVVEVEPGYFLEDPYTTPDVLEFNDIKSALNYIIDYNGNNHYLSNIRFIREK